MNIPLPHEENRTSDQTALTGKSKLKDLFTRKLPSLRDLTNGADYMNLPPTGEAAKEEGGRADSVSEDVMSEPVGYFKISAWFNFSSALSIYLYISLCCLLPSQTS